MTNKETQPSAASLLSKCKVNVFVDPSLSIPERQEVVTALMNNVEEAIEEKLDTTQVRAN